MPLNFGRTVRFGAAARGLNQRVLYFSMMALALGLLVLSRVEERAAENLRMGVVDTLAPVISALSQPVEATKNASAAITRYLDVAAENTKLSQEVARLRQWQDVAGVLETENEQFRRLLAVKAESTTYLITGRLIADTGGPFLRSGLVNVGSDDGVRSGMAVTNEAGFIGHIVASAAHTSRVLFLDDLNSRIPVVIQPSGLQAIVSGNNTDRLTLDFVSDEVVIPVGAQLVTSGHGGLFPPGIPVGSVSEVEEGRIIVSPHVNWSRVGYVAVHDFLAVQGMADAVEAPPGPQAPVASNAPLAGSN